MANNENKENKYREERKARIAKQKKKGKGGLNDEQLDKMGKVIGIVLAVVLCVGLVTGLISFFGIPQKLATAVKVGDKKYSVAEYNYFYTATFLSYYNQAYSYDSQYGEGMGKLFTGGFDIAVSPDLQTKEITVDEEASATEDSEIEEGTTSAADETISTTKTITWTEYFHQMTVETLEQFTYYLEKAEEEGIEIDDEAQAEIDEQIETIRGYATSNNNHYSVSRYIALQYGKGLNEKTVRKILKWQALVDAYLEAREDSYAADVTDEEIEEVYNQDTTSYDVIDIRLFGFPLEAYFEDEDVTETATYTDDEQYARAEEFVSKATSEELFYELAKEYAEDYEAENFEDDSATYTAHVDKSTISSNVNDEAAEWAMTAEAGEIKYFATDTYIYVIYIVNPAYRNEETLKNVRHLLVTFEEDTVDDVADDADLFDLALALYNGEATVEEGTTTVVDTTEEGTTDVIETLPTKSEILATLGGYIQEYYNGTDEIDGSTEEAFANIANLYSEDTSSTSDDAGGLISDIDRGTYVSEFEDWAYDESRQPGDIDIIESSYGYHIMYFVSANDEPSWKADIRSTIASEKQTEAESADEANYADTAVESTVTMKWAYKKAEKFVVDMYENINSQS